MTTFKISALLKSAAYVLVGLSLPCLRAAGQAIPDAPAKLVIHPLAEENISSGAVALQLDLPAGSSLKGLNVTLNGADVRLRFSEITCPETCLTGLLSSAEGLHAGKNVLYAFVKALDGRVLSGGYRFDVAGRADVRALASSSPVSGRASVGVTNVNVASDGGSTFLSPTVFLKTLTPGGWQGPGQPWIQVGAQTYPSASAPACSGLYEVVVLDRQTLAEKTSAPEASPFCAASASALSTYLGGLNATDLAIVGTLWTKNPDAGLNTSAIGGSDHTKDSPYPLGYLAIGAGGTASGTAYEEFGVYFGTHPPVSPFANGLLQEDTSGNYNFQSSGVREYWVDPMDTDTASGVTGFITVEADAAVKTTTGFDADRFLRPANTSRGGYWLLVLDRSTLTPVDLETQNSSCQTTSTEGSMHLWTGCGTTYATGDLSNPGNQTSAYNNLAADLSNIVGPQQLAILTSFGYPACCGTYFDVAYEDGYISFTRVLEGLGGSARATLFRNNTNNQVYTFVTSAGLGDPLTGGSVQSATAYSDSGESGFIHGALSRNQNGLYSPTQTAQQANAADDAAAGPDYTLTKVAVQSPVVWPEFGTAPISGADSTAGQTAAYRYISYMLITQHYIKGAAGQHLDDLHYYFTGSNSNYINYHFFDPINLLYPGAVNAPYCWTDPVTNAALPCFSQNDFSAISKQVSAEIVDLVNVLNFMVTGPVNLKDTVASGNASAGLALTGAAAAILSSALQPPPSTPVKLNTANILSMLSGVASIAAGIASDGSLNLVDSVISNRVGKIASVIGGTLAAAGAATGGLVNQGTVPSNGSRYQAFATTIGTLASSQLQGQLSIGFDLSVDSILSDWGRLNAIGPLVTDTRNATFYAPNQIAQNAAVHALGLGAQRSFFISLMPQIYSLHLWRGGKGVNVFDSRNQLTNQPDMAGTNSACEAPYHPFYLDWSSFTAPSTSFFWSPTPSKWFTYPTIYYSNDFPVDMYVIAAKSAANPGTSSTKIQVLSQDLGSQLFSTQGLNIPLDEFVSYDGVFHNSRYDMTGGDLTTLTRFKPSDICSSRPGADFGATPPAASPFVPTTTTLSAPAAVVLGENASFKATVSHVSGTVQAGSVFLIGDGKSLAEVKLDGSGSALFTLSPSLGAHTYQALYSLVRPYETSSSAVMPVTVYANAPDLTLSLSQSSLQTTYGASSSMISVQVSSLSGASGTVQLSCSGLPVNMNCSFDSPTLTLGAGASITTGVKVISSGVVKAGINFSGRILSALSLLSLLGLWRARRSYNPAYRLALMLFVAIGFTMGCSSTPSQPIQESGPKTVLVNATLGQLTRTAPLLITIQ